MSACDTEQAPLHRSVVVFSIEGFGVISWRLPFIFQQPCNTARSSQQPVAVRERQDLACQQLQGLCLDASSNVSRIDYSTQSKFALQQLSPDRMFGGLVSFGGNLWMYGGISRVYYDNPGVTHDFLNEDETYMMKLNMRSHIWEPVSCRNAPANRSICLPQSAGEQCMLCWLPASSADS